MRDLYGDDYESVAGGGADRLIPDGVRRLSGAAVFLALIAALGLWSFRLGTRDASEVPIIKAMEGPARVEPANPGGLQAAHQGLEVNTVLAGRPAPLPRELAAGRGREPAALQAEDAPQGELVLAAPAILAARVLGEDGDLPMPAQEDIATLGPDDAVDAAVGRHRRGPDRVPDGRRRPAAAQPAGEPGAGPAEEGRRRGAEAGGGEAPAKAERQARGDQGRLGGAGAGGFGRAVRGRGWSSSAPSTARRSPSEAWSQLVAKNPDLLSSKNLYVERTTANARVFYRLRVAGFASSEETRQMCEALRSRGVACIPVTLQ